MFLWKSSGPKGHLDRPSELKSTIPHFTLVKLEFQTSVALRLASFFLSTCIVFEVKFKCSGPFTMLHSPLAQFVSSPRSAPFSSNLSARAKTIYNSAQCTPPASATFLKLTVRNIMSSEEEYSAHRFVLITADTTPARPPVCFFYSHCPLFPPVSSPTLFSTAKRCS